MPQPYQPSTFDKKAVYLQKDCRQIFRQPHFAKLRKAKPIRETIQRHSLSVWLYSQDQLVRIIQALLEDGIFESDDVARHHFPELFKPIAAESTVPEPTITAVSSALGHVPKDLQHSMQAGLLHRRALLFDSGKYSDLTVIGGKEYRVHRNIVCDFSRVLEVACEFSSKAGQLIEPDAAQNTDDTPNETHDDDTSAHTKPYTTLSVPDGGLTSVVDLQQENPMAVDCMMQFFYHLNYDPRAFANSHAKASIDDSPRSALYIHTLVHKLAEVYEVDDLKALSLSKIEHEMANPIDVVDFTKAAQEAYVEMHETYTALRQAFVKGFHQHRKQLLPNAQSEELLHSNGVLGYDIIMYFNQHGCYRY